MKLKQHDAGKQKVSGSYAAKLLFQFRVIVDGSSGTRRLCEERIIAFSSKNATAALCEAKKRGRDAEYSYKNNEKNWVHFEFVGVLELLRLDPGCEPDEVWFEIKERILPMERRASILLAENKLSAIRNRE